MSGRNRPKGPSSDLPRMSGLHSMDSFWNQHPHLDSISLVLIEGDHMDKVRQIVNPPHEEFESVSVKEVIDSPANLMESLRRRARGAFGHADAFFRASTYTAMLEGPKSESALEPRETHRIARLCGARVVALDWGRNTSIKIVIAEPEGIVSAGGSSDELRMVYAKTKNLGHWIAPHPLVTGDPTTRQVETMMRDELKLDFRPDLLDDRPVTFFARKVKVKTLHIPSGRDMDQLAYGWKLTAKDAELIAREAIEADARGMARRGDSKPWVESRLPIIAGGAKVWRVAGGAPPPVGDRTYDVDAMTGVATRVM